MSSAHSPTFPSLHLRHSYSPTLPSLYLRHSSFSNPSVASPTSQFILQPFFPFSYARSFSHSSFSNISITSPTSQLILQPFRRFTYVIAHLQPFRCFTYVTAHSPTLLSPPLRHKIFTYFTWRAAHGKNHYGRRAYLVCIGSLDGSSGISYVTEQ